MDIQRQRAWEDAAEFFHIQPLAPSGRNNGAPMHHIQIVGCVMAGLAFLVLLLACSPTK